MRESADPHLWGLKPGAESPYMPAYKAFDEMPAPERCKKAFDLIRPPLEHRGECERQIVFAIQSVEFAKRFETVPNSPAATKQRFRKLAKMLQRASETIAKLSNNPVDQAKKLVDAYGQIADAIPVPKGSQRQRESKKVAVYMAHWLLTLFGDAPPGMSRDGRWHKLADTLYDGKVDFSYLRDQRKRNLGPRLFPS
jgi:hypothetical protein